MNRITKQKDALLRRMFRTIDVPDDLGPITDIDWKQEVDPTSVSLDEAATDSMWQAMEDFYHSGVHPLVSVCVRRQGKIVLNRSIGYAREDKVASLDTPICMFSASKAVSSVLIHLLAEQGKINLLDPVSYYIPQFASKGKGSISILQLLSHRGGIPGIPEGTDVELLFDQEAALDLICDAEPDDHQGRIQAYHAVTSGFIFAELIRVTTGMNPQQYLDRYIRKPMGMRYFRYGLTQREKPHAAEHAITGFNSELINRGLTSVIGAHPDEVVRITCDPRWFKTIIPSANIYATAEEVTRFFQMLLNNGEWGGKQILQPLTVHRATRSMGKTELDKSLMMPMRYSAGFMLGGNPIGIFGKNTQYAYGHLGFANIFCWADPERDIAVAVMNTGKLALGPHLKTLPALIGTISEQCPPLVDMDGDIPVYHRGRKPRN
jgi:CubicO group peptidase (beta-lactamase class C family)